MSGLDKMKSQILEDANAQPKRESHKQMHRQRKYRQE